MHCDWPSIPTTPTRSTTWAGSICKRAAKRTRWRLSTRALALEPRHFQALHDFGILHARNGEWQKAEELIRGAIDARPDSAEAHYSLGLVCAQQTQYEQAEKLFLAAIQLRSGYPEALSDVFADPADARSAAVLERARKGNRGSRRLI
jgi:Flp pilus assembly protein TadD